jgi:hypothetical protein
MSMKRAITAISESMPGNALLQLSRTRPASSLDWLPIHT